MKKVLALWVLLLLGLPFPAMAALKQTVQINDIAWSPDGHQLAIATSLGAVVYDVSNDPQLLWSKRIGWVNTLTFDHAGSRLAAGLGTGDRLNGGFVEVWKAKSGTNVISFVANTFAVRALAFSPDDEWLATGGGYIPTRSSGDYRVRVWETSTWREVAVFDTAHIGHITSLAFSPDGHLLASAGQDDSVTLEEVQKGTIISAVHVLYAARIVFSADNRFLTFVGYQGLQVWELHSEPEWYLVRQAQWEYSPQSQSGERVLSAAVFSARGNWFATFSNDHYVHIRDIQNNQDVMTHLPTNQELVGGVFSPDGKYLATWAGSQANNENGAQNVQIWSLEGDPSRQKMLDIN